MFERESAKAMEQLKENESIGRKRAKIKNFTKNILEKKKKVCYNISTQKKIGMRKEKIYELLS